MTVHRARTRRPPWIMFVLALAPALLIAAVVSIQPRTGAPAASPIRATPTAPSSGDTSSTEGPWTLVGAGDIAHCDVTGDEATAELIAEIDGTVFTAGDNAYPHGTAEDFENCFGPSWGQFLDRIRPALGTHEYDTNDAAAYFEYFGAAAGAPGLGYYSYDLGPWHVVVLNTNCGEVPGGCEERSPQTMWLRQDLIDAGARCTVVISGHPRFSSGVHGDNTRLRHLFHVLHDERVELFVSGHDHNYERIAPLDPEGFVDQDRGVRQFVVGTGGRSLRAIGEPRPGSEKALVEYGVLRLTLHPDRYEWAFIATDHDVIDEGEGDCR